MRHGVWHVEKKRSRLVVLDEFDRLFRIPLGERCLVRRSLDDLFTTLSLLSDEIRAGDANAVSARLADMDAHLSRVLELRAEVGGRINRLELCTDRLADMKVSLTEMRSEVEDADLVQAVVDLETQENIYQATASAAARIGQLSLLDFL